MAQHDYNIANQTGLEFRQDLNNALGAIVTQNSGGTAPTDTFPGMKWLDTSTNPPVEKRRNQTNNAWETTLTEAGRTLCAANNAAAQRTAIGAQATLVSGTNIKTINGVSVLGSGNIDVSVQTATETQAGIVELATAAEVKALANDTKALTPAKVREVLGNFSDFFSFAVNTTFDIDHAGGVYAPIVSGLTSTLPKCSTLPPGSTLTFFGNGLGVTIQRGDAGDGIALGSKGVIPSFTIKGFDEVQLVNSGTYWYAISGEALLGASSSFASSLSGNGYQKLPSGLILQWGASTPTGGAQSISLPISFPNSFLAVVPQMASANTSEYAFVSGFKTSNSAFTLMTRSNNGALYPYLTNWVAIGY